jgi:hypothetical protein
MVFQTRWRRIHDLSYLIGKSVNDSILEQLRMLFHSLESIIIGQILRKAQFLLVHCTQVIHLRMEWKVILSFPFGEGLQRISYWVWQKSSLLLERLLNCPRPTSRVLRTLISYDFKGIELDSDLIEAQLPRDKHDPQL